MARPGEVQLRRIPNRGQQQTDVSPGSRHEAAAMRPATAAGAAPPGPMSSHTTVSRVRQRAVRAGDRNVVILQDDGTGEQHDAESAHPPPPGSAPGGTAVDRRAQQTEKGKRPRAASNSRTTADGRRWSHSGECLRRHAPTSKVGEALAGITGRFGTFVAGSAPTAARAADEIEQVSRSASDRRPAPVRRAVAG